MFAKMILNASIHLWTRFHGFCLSLADFSRPTGRGAWLTTARMTFVSIVFPFAGAAFGQTLPQPPDQTGSDGDFMKMIGTYLLKAFGIMIVSLMIAATLFIAWGIITKVNDWRKGRAELGDVVGVTLGGIVALAVVAIILVFGLKVLTDNEGFMTGSE